MTQPASTRRKPQARTLLTRARILDTARDMAKDQSLEELTAEALATRAGVAKGTVFAHFGDMDGLLSHLLLDRLEDLNTASGGTGAADEAGDDPLAAVLDHMMALILVMTESQTMMRVFMENIGVTKGNCAPEFVAQLDRWDAQLVEILSRWQQAQTAVPPLRQDMDPATLLDGLIAFTIHGAILKQSCQVRDPDALRNRLRTHIAAYLTP